jgi:superfamily II DNA/RNA helicase
MLNEGGPFDEPGQFATACHRRLVRALARGAAGGILAGADLVALIAHVLRRDEALSPEQAVWLRVPISGALDASGGVWPSAESWRAAGLGVRDESGRFRLTPRRWEPAWLPGPYWSALAKPLYTEEYRRTYEEVAGDPFLRVVGRSRYRCDAQREAIRAILSVPDGSTVVINLPTGAGKSFCSQLPALLMSERAGVSVVVVPTTALALDQERAVRQWVPHNTAYVGGTTATEQDTRQEIRARIRSGSQRILFTSPESLLQSLRPALYDAVRRGLLRLLVVDEAHMVEQWGDEFRSAFQEVAGLRTDLLRHVSEGSQPFITLLLTATLTETGLDTLETLFGEPGPLAVVSAPQLRPEPSYWAIPVSDTDAQAATVLDAILHLPRPLLLYVTEPFHADSWAGRLRSEGFRRVDVVTGRTPNEQRARVVQRWADADTDIVVATSAFGLGVDQGDVRVVIHATLPENVDRYYQEVGRAGRDGAASASLVVYTPEDTRRAESMNRKRIIGIERGQERWTRMFARRVALGNDRFRVPIDVQPSFRAGDIDMESDLNRAWNVRTLTLMSRARLMTLDAEPPPVLRTDSAGTAAADAEAEARERYELERREHERHRVVSLRHHGTTITAVWEREVEPVRRRTYDSDFWSHTQMRETLQGTRCVGDILAEAYTIPSRAGDRPRDGVNVASACGGCEYCRSTGRHPYAEPLPIPSPQWPVAPSVSAGFNELRGHRCAIAIFYDSLAPHRLSRFLHWVVGQGVRIAIMPASALVEWAEQLYQPGTEGRWVFTYPLDVFRYMFAPKLPSLVFLPQGETLPLRVRRELDTDCSDAALRLLVAPADTPDPNRPHATLRSMLACRTYGFDEFSTRIGL